MKYEKTLKKRVIEKTREKICVFQELRVRQACEGWSYHLSSVRWPA